MKKDNKLARVLSADLFETLRSKLVYALLALSAALGFLIPLMYYGLVLMMKAFSNVEILANDPSIAAALSMLDALNAKTVFLAALPVSQGAGVLTAAMIGFRAVRPFGTGIYRNKVIAGIPRRDVYFSQTLYSFMLSALSMLIYTCTAALAARLTFGELGIPAGYFCSILLVSLGVYTFYGCAAVLAAFLTRSVPVTLIVSILVPILGEMVISMISAVLIGAPEWLLALLSVLPPFQSALLAAAEPSGWMLAASLISDCVLSAVIVVLGAGRFRRADMR